MPAHSLFLALCAVASPPTDPIPVQPTISVDILPAAVRFHVGGPEELFLCGVLGSFTPKLQHFVTALPPMLADSVVLDVGYGYGEKGYVTVLPESRFPPGLFVYVQGVTLASGQLMGSDVASFVLDAGAPESPTAESR